MYFGNLPEEYLLILIDSEENRISVKNNLLVQFSLTGAILLELIIRGRIAVNEDDIIVVDDTPVDDDLIQDGFNLILEEEDVLSARYWIRHISEELDDLKKRVIKKLTDKEIIEVEKTKKWFFFEETKYQVIMQEMEDTIRSNIKRLIDANEESDPRALAFLSLLYASGATGQIFSQEEIDEYHHDIKGMVDDEAIGKSIISSIRMITDALMRSQIINYGHFML